MWGGPTPHNLETLCLCYVDQTHREVPISSSNRNTVWKGGETTFSFPRSSLPRCRVVITQREVLIRLGILSDANAVEIERKVFGILSRLWRLWGQTPACSSIRQLDAERGFWNWSMQIQQMQMPIRPNPRSLELAYLQL